MIIRANHEYEVCKYSKTILYPLPKPLLRKSATGCGVFHLKEEEKNLNAQKRFKKVERYQVLKCLNE